MLKDRKWPEKPGGGICEFQEVAPESEEPSTGTETEKSDVEMKSLEETIIPNKSKKKTVKKKTLAENGQTFLDVSKGDITITENGAVGGGLSDNETELNPRGYWITGSTSSYRVTVNKDVKTTLTLDNVDITVDSRDCINVSHAYVTIILVGNNRLYCDCVGADFTNGGCAINKDGMDGELVIKCQNSDKDGHICNNSCGSLNAKGNPDKLDICAIGSSLRGTKKEGEAGFSNLTIKGGNIDVSGGGHSCGIGAACTTEHNSGGKGYAKNIRIYGGNIKATGTSHGAGIGGGLGTRVEGIYIYGGKVEAKGGTNAPGIGTSKMAAGYNNQSMKVNDIQIRGGDTIVIAIGDSDTDMPGIGSGGGSSLVTNVTATPEFGYQGYIQDGVSLTDYSFVAGTPFKEKKEINVSKFYTKVYFSPFRDANGIEDSTKEQIGANHVISQTGGAPFTEEQLKGLSMVTGKQENGSDFPIADLTYVDKSQLDAVNEAKTAGKTGEYPVTFTTPNGTTATVTVFLKNKGTDAADIHPEQMEPTIAADDYGTDSGGDAWTEEEVQKLCDVKGKNENGATYDQKDLKPDTDQLTAINEVKTAGKGGKFDLTFTSPGGKKATVEVVLKAYDETTEENGEIIKGRNIISQTGGAAFTDEQLKEFSGVVAWDDTAAPIVRADLVLTDRAQIEEINQAKTAGKIGDYPLTIATPTGTQITIHVYLRDQGNSHEEGKEASSIGANGFTKPTGGKLFTEDEIKELCKAVGKDPYGNNELPAVDAEQVKKINEAKDGYRTGEFPLTFTLKDGTKTVVTITLTGVHKVSFDSDGGDYQPEDQMVNGGEKASEPREPKRDGYTFEGWYYTDEDGNEHQWDFDTPVNESMTLKAKWRKVSETTPDNETSKPTETQKKNKKENRWNYKEIQTNRTVAKTGEESNLPWVLGCLAGAIGVCVCMWKKRIE